MNYTIEDKLDGVTVLIAEKKYIEAKELLKKCYQVNLTDKYSNVDFEGKNKDLVRFNTLCNILMLEESRWTN